MNDYIKSAAGGEVTDQSFRATGPAKPVWLLTPLPLRQIDPTSRSRQPRTTHVRSLHSLCLSTISRSFHTYSPWDLATLPPLTVQRIIARVRTERSYEDGQSASEVAIRPDEATIWAYSALLDPEGTSTSMTLGMPTSSTLQFLSPSKNPADKVHPLVDLPVLFRQLQPARFQLVTTLSLEGIDDRSIQPLRYCTHLTGLWTRSSKITDAGVRLLASAIELPGDANLTGKGMWRLRTWILRGSKGVSDRSARSFARWPGLVLLDLRDTSCTSAFHQAHHFASSRILPELASFQPCTDGLLSLFSNARPAATTRYLFLTLLKPQGSAITAEQTQPYLSLHIVPSMRSIPPEHLPFPPPAESSSGTASTLSRKSAYNSGYGQLYGSGVSRISDTAMTFRESVKYALHCEARDECYQDLLDSGKRITAKVKEQWGDYQGMTDKQRKSMYERNDKRREKERKMASVVEGERGLHLMGKVYKDGASNSERGEGANGRSKAFVKGNDRVGEMDGGMEGSEGDRWLMLVRMSPEGWESLQWVTTAGESAPVQDTSLPVRSSQPNASLGSMRSGNLIGDILSTSRSQCKSARPGPRQPSYRSSPPTAVFDLPSQRSSSPASSPLPTPPPPKSSSNPFRQPTQTIKNGIRPLGLSPFTIQIKAEAEDDAVPGGVGAKRRFAGEAGEEPKRRGMKMFSGRRLG